MDFRKLIFPLAVAGMAVLGSSCSQQDPSQVVMNNILARKSVRAYQSTPVPDDMVQTLLRAGMAAPSAVNKQPWHFVVVNDTAILRQLALNGRGSAPLSTAPLAIVVCGNLQKQLDNGMEYWPQDCSAAVENILLSATSMGLGTVWMGGYPNKERADVTQKALGLPSYLMPLATIAVGYPAENPDPKDKWNEANISYNVYDSAAAASQQVATAMPESDLLGFRKIDVKKDWKENPFAFFKGDGHGLLLAVGNEEKMNAMAIGWGGLGVLWGMDRPVVTVYVRKSRYTHELMEKNTHFTISALGQQYDKALAVMGSESGRSTDKVKKTGLKVDFTKSGNPVFADANTVLECKVLYQVPYDLKNANLEDDFKNNPDISDAFVAEIVNAWVK